MRKVSILTSVLTLTSSLFCQGIIINHNHIDYTKIPTEWITKAKNDLRIGYGHTSHGSQLVTGMDALKAANSTFDYEKSYWELYPGIFFNDYWGNAGGADDLGHNGYLGWRDATIQMLNLPNNDRDVVMWSWCGGVSDNTVEGIDVYLNAMNELEASYPNVKFIYMTGHLDGSGAEGILHLRNQQIRDYCSSNNKILFDFADIESYDPNANLYYMPLYATDGCWYDSNGDGDPWEDENWAANWVNNNPTSHYTQSSNVCEECAHSEHLNCVQKGGAVWWLFARLVGWDGSLTDISDSKETIEDFNLAQNYPNPFNPATVISYQLPVPGIVQIKIHDMLGREISTLVNEFQNAGFHHSTFSALNNSLPSGVYYYTFTTSNYTVSKKMMYLK
ncbi:MAG: T9SS type A sorting domain-containing protein [bacterium]